MHLTLFVPDLLWPDHEHRQAFEFDQADALARFLFLAEHTASPFQPTTSWESILAETFGLSGEAAALGALRLLGESDSRHSQTFSRTLLCADPVNLGFIQQALVLSKADASQLDDDAAQELIASLNEEFTGEGVFFRGHSTTSWYFAPTTPNNDLANLAACSRFLGRRIDADESRQVLGHNGLRWLNRIQMCLNDHPVNEARLMQGLVTINSVWPWGAGLLPNSAPPSTRQFEQAFGDNALLRGLCTFTGTAHSETAPGSHGLLLNTDLGDAIAHDDLNAWQNAVNQLAQTHIAPALGALARGELTRLTIIAPDAHQTHRWTLEANHKDLKPSFLQRCLGRAHNHPELATLVGTW